MRKLGLWIGGALAAITLIWWQAAADFVLSNGNDFFRLRASLIQITGILALSLMTMVMILAMRFTWLERWCGGLDKAYHWHKWLGISAMSLAAGHWLLVKSPHYLISWGMLLAPTHGHTGWDVSGDALQAWVSSLRQSALLAGEWGFYALLLLTAIALLCAIGYRQFKLTHKLMGLGFMAIAFHGLLLLKRSYWPFVITPLVISIALIGTLAALRSLLGRIGNRHNYPAKVVAVNYHPASRTNHVILHVANWPGHQAGQYAYLKFANEPPHPFTISSCDRHNQRLEFLIKELGEFTHRLKATVHCGDTLHIEGPYGGFQFAEPLPSVWIAGGVGIAAFTAILEQRALTPSECKVTLYYCTLTPDPELIAELKTRARQANVDLRVIDNRTEPKLDAQRLQRDIPDLLQRSIWFCGPAPFARALRLWLTQQGYPRANFHCEDFNLR